MEMRSSHSEEDHMLRMGLIGEAITTVTEEQSALSMGSGNLRVFATPAMIALMEAAAVAAIDPTLEEDRASVGIEINVRHVAATPLGERVTAMAEITRIDGKRITCEVRAWDENSLIGEGTHTRYIIDIDRFMEKLGQSAGDNAL